jgi:hypothetical protein
MPRNLLKALGNDGDDQLDFTSYQNQPSAENAYVWVDVGGNSDGLFAGTGNNPMAATEAAIGTPSAVDGGHGNDYVVTAASQQNDHLNAAAAAPQGNQGPYLLIPGTNNFVIDGVPASGDFLLV